MKQKKKTDFAEKLAESMQKYPVSYATLFFLIYILLFTLAETKEPDSVFLIETELDHLIPFSKYAVFLYCTWHVEIMAILLSFLFCRDLQGYWLTAAKLLSGLFLILVICTVFPNMVDLRPAAVEGDDVFASLTRLVYTMDNSRNVFPSGHALGAVLMAKSWGRIGNRSWQRGIAWAMNAGIIASTFLLKQHSVIDAAGGIVLAVLVDLTWEIIVSGQRKRKETFKTAI